MENKGIVGALFDLSFSEFVTTRVIKILFILGMIFAGIGTLIVIGGGFKQGIMRGLGMLILSPLLFLIWVLLVRIWCEMVIVIFRIAENTSRMANRD